VGKVFIVARERHDLYASLCRALQSEGDVFVIYDRRSRAEPPRRRGGWRRAWADSDEPESGDRRQRSDVDDDIRERGFGVVHVRDEDLEHDDPAYADE
jgi:hypothetical protein